MATIENPKHLKQMGICFKVSKNEKKNIKWHRMSCKKPNSVLFWVIFLGGGFENRSPSYSVVKENARRDSVWL